MDKKTLFLKIEKCREEMMTLSKEHGLSSKAVLATSEKLDELIYAYLKRSS
ncbi:aspartyl-phosphate phosphatase Spo0E family protein [Oceanobacillus sojae]|uniref:aspartyl-phosphate phosphatase Spo0E family protein n=1 Tax=Oceanobacillus sojae TaxID=582851 RepID=UPI0021A4D4BE|nr:aspartyl-phosphate phosphatase Spo0E family protein [Oceanobacillus sojae]MCT1904808.1 aspartyl-phosphate phosphatase Spo0E family protein [Oceanobacillus sojae]